ncbi:MAG TPA: hypothetical protein VGM24_01870 [Puia sp.]
MKVKLPGVRIPPSPQKRILAPAAKLRVFCLEQTRELVRSGCEEQKTKAANGRLKVQKWDFNPPQKIAEGKLL